MEIVIVGGGKLGYALCRDLVIEGHEIVLIDKDPIRIEAFQEELDIRCILGNGSAREVLLEADVPQCDVFIAVTPSDETNIIAVRHCRTELALVSVSPECVSLKVRQRSSFLPKRAWHRYAD